MGRQALTFGESTSLRVIMAAKRKPRDVSDARWRMELSRREAYEANGGFYTPDAEIAAFGIRKR